MINSFYESLKTHTKILGISCLLLVSLLMGRIVVTITEVLSINLPIRAFMATNIFFISILPVVIVFISAEKMDFKTSFFLPFIIKGAIYPITYAFFLDPLALLPYPGYYIGYLIGGIGLGIVGLAGNIYNRKFIKSVILFTIGIAIILMNSVNVIPVFYYVVTGDITPLLKIPNLL